MASSPRDALREQVAQVIYESDRGPHDGDWLSLASDERLEYARNADAAIRVVLAVVVEQIEALPGPSPFRSDSPEPYEQAQNDALAVVARLGKVPDES